MKKIYALLIVMGVVLFCDSAMAMGKVFFIDVFDGEIYEYYDSNTNDKNIILSEAPHSRNLNAIIFRTGTSNTIEHIKIQNNRSSGQVTSKNNFHICYIQDNNFSEASDIVINSRQSEISRTISQRK